VKDIVIPSPTPMRIELYPEAKCPHASERNKPESLGLETSDSNLHFLNGNGGHIEIFSYRRVIFNDLA
jgi:hypothetical protein